MSRPPNTSPQTRRLLAELNSQPQAWRYGYELSKATGLKSGTLYPLLSRLSDQGFLEAEWRLSVQAGRPARHAYRLTAAGIVLAATSRGQTSQGVQNLAMKGAMT